MVGILIVIDTIKLHGSLSILPNSWTGTHPLTCCQGSLNLRTTSGGEASRSKHFTFHLFIFEFIMSQFTFSSSAIESISDVQDGKVTITFNGGRDYTYGVQDVEMFVSQLSAVIANQQSVGRFVNNAIKSEQLVAAWCYNTGEEAIPPLSTINHKESWNFSTQKTSPSLI